LHLGLIIAALITLGMIGGGGEALQHRQSAAQGGL